MSRVEVKEYGARPALMTPARLNAPQGAKAIADLAHESGVVDYLSIVIDWDGSHFMGEQSFNKPIIYIYAAKYFQNINRTAYIEIPLDMEEAFSQSNFNSVVAAELVQHIAEEFEKKLSESYHMKGIN